MIAWLGPSSNNKNPHSNLSNSWIINGSVILVSIGIGYLLSTYVGAGAGAGAGDSKKR